MGPLLFIIYINDFSRASTIFDFICYAGDTRLFCTLSKLVNAQNANPDITINIELAKINEWLEINKISINFKKKFMVFHTHSKNAKAVVPRINNTNLEKVEQFQFIGITLSWNLNWKKNHSDNVTNKCSRIIGIMNRLNHYATTKN